MATREDDSKTLAGQRDGGQRGMTRDQAREGSTARREKREFVTAGGTPGNTTQAKPTDPAALEGVTGTQNSGEVDNTRLAGDPSPGTPDRDLSPSQRQTRDRLRREQEQFAATSQGGARQTSGDTGTKTSGGVKTVTSGPAPTGTANPSDAPARGPAGSSSDGSR